MGYVKTKDPDEVLDWNVEWTTELSGDTISTSTFTVDGVTLDSDSNTTTDATAWISGGTLGALASITNEIVTASGRTFNKSINYRIVVK
jgi:hypothetical protein|tara:strand:- start:414 stop:680 length:267 start_codon:yes stop_codon:yes gene_type:complete